jgi:chromosome segregation ATPase
VDYLKSIRNFICISGLILPFFFQAQLSSLETQLADSQEKLKTEQELRVAAEERVKSLEKAASEAAAKLVTLTSEHEKERQLLVQRAEEAESCLQPISAELGGLKLHIRQMSHAIFGTRQIS